MVLKLYNTLTRKKEEFKVIKDKKVGLYTCGPTVYQYAHIGNLRTYIFEDILKRVLLFNGFKVNHVMNITDVGHLTSDSDTGEDKIELGAKREGKSAWEIAKFYENAFKDDLKKLNILFPDIWCKATDHIKEQIELVKTLEKKGFTYKTSDGIYFDTSKLKDYGKLAKLNLKGLKAGARINLGEKRNITDFALWKFSSSEQKRQMEWKSPWSERGFPGWHLECSAMSMKYLGNTFDIHCGGIDHITVHHTNEIAQSEAATGKKFVNYWLHGNFLVLKYEKMAKSGEFLTLQKLIEKNYDPMEYRYFCLNAHYRQELTFTYEALNSAKIAYSKLKENILDIKKSNNKGVDANNYREKFLESINDNLNMPRALAVTWDLIKDNKIDNKDRYKALVEFDKVLGLNLDKVKEEKIPKEISKLIELREKARNENNFLLSDKIRKQINEKGYIIEDTTEGVKIKKNV